ncbi:alpha/beta fold hydrolase [Nocardiopsis mangrovi]|uniref:Alpha/beta fold hydrolase n=1 Tax=Nocardiopsis mangrovi TaxID=1179818 RepID=A0ABV9E0G9_9ACTN
MPFADLPGVRMFYSDDGPAAAPRPLLLVHGWGADSHEWVQHLPGLAAGNRILAPDLRGHGYSGVPDQGNTPRAMAADLAALLDRARTGPVAAVGHSMGGQVVGHLALERPDLVGAVVTVDPAYGYGRGLAPAFTRMAEELRGPDPIAAALALDAWDYTDDTPPWIRAWHTRRLLAARPHVLAESFAAMFAEPGAVGVRPASDAFVGRRRQPTLSFWSDAGRADWERAVLAHPRSRSVHRPGTGHRLHEEHPGDFVRDLLHWLGAPAPGPATAGPERPRPAPDL